MINKPQLKIKAYSLANMKIYICNKDKIILEILNIIRRIIFITAKTNSIASININNKATEFSYITATEEDILTIIINIKDVRLLIKNCKQLQLKITKKGRCFFKARDIAIQKFCKVFNSNKILAKINHTKVIKIIITIIKQYKAHHNFICPTNNYKNTIAIKATRNPIKKIAISNNVKHPFIKIHTNETICPIYCFIKANTYLLQQIPLSNTTQPKLPLIYKNKTLFKSLNTTKLKLRLKTLLKLNKIKTLIETLEFNNNICYVPLSVNYRTQLIIELLKQGFHTIK
ncbi:hypothetical protein JS520_00780 [Candidatus Vidania fulgoroideae]|nr:hypothetical protein JS520_00780 [Candidatus Vidania fulgoroideae]